jgi:molybdate transport system substrate-binding protein
VPVGRYTAQVLAKLEASGHYGADFQARVQQNVVSLETNVRAVLAKVALREADAGFVYVTDAAAAGDKVRVLEIPEASNEVVAYRIGVVTRSAAPAQARAFVDLALGRQGQAVLHKHGFAR